MKPPYQIFNKFVFRTPLLPITTISTAIINSKIFEEAIFLASRDLLEALKDEEGKKFESFPSKLQFSLFKYLLRMSTRCTPFGLFAGCGTGSLSEDGINQIQIEDFRAFKTVTRLDMDLIVIICNRITNDKVIRRKLLFFPNNTLYTIGTQYRYVDYKYINKKRSYILSEIDTNDYIILILERAKNGVLLDDLVKNLGKMGDYSTQELEAFLDELIESQILVSELYHTVTGKDATAHLIRLLSRPEIINVTQPIVSFLCMISESLGEIDKLPVGRNIDSYRLLESHIRELGVAYNPKFLFQSDLFIDAKKVSVNKSIALTLYDALFALNKLSLPSSSAAVLSKFKDAFYKRYEDEEVALIEVLDTDIGIGFSNLGPESAAQNNLLDDLILENKRPNRDINLSVTEYLLLKKYHEFLSSKSTEITLTDEDLSNLPEKWDDLPPTLSAMVEVFSGEACNGEPFLAISGFGGPSASNLLTRFANGNSDILEVVKEITAKEETFLKNNQIFAEIVHLPEARTGNVLYRPVVREYEIPYLAFAGVDEAHTIPISDIYISVTPSKKLVLRSRKLNKEIIPRLSSAHNFSNNSLPIYHFLAISQFEGIRSGVSFNWGPLLSGEKYLPKVIYKNVILSPATWIIEEKDIRMFEDINDDDFNQAIIKLQDERNLPAQCLICYSDNKLFIDFSNKLSVRLFLTEVKKNKKIKVEEFLFRENDLMVQDAQKRGYTNQFIFSFYKNING